MNSETQAVYDALAATKSKSLRESANFDSNRTQLLTDLRLVMADADKLIREAAGASTDAIAAMYTRLEARLAETKAKLAEAGAAAGSKAQQAAVAATAYARANPWRAVTLVVAAGVLAGFFFGRRPAAQRDPD